MKRKAADSQAANRKPSKKKFKTSLSEEEAKKRFRKGLFDKNVLDAYTKDYAESTPYKHSVIHGLIDDKLLRAVRDEVKENVSFTQKETDIYKIHQSGDLANLDGLEDEALAKLPSLLALRDAMYSQAFRDYVAHITGCGPLSGRKTDLAINIYTPGSFLLCHDDVIGSRKVSFILYLTDPEIPWKPEWGGALRLFPVHTREGKKGEEVAKTPAPDVTKIIPPAWNQLSFFAVQPGESFHDVEEVYHADSPKQLKKQGGRVRMAISGWFHIPQIGEDGYVEGAEEKAAKNSSLMQLQGNPDQYDMPQAKPVAVRSRQSGSQEDFSEADLEFLLKYMAPTYLTPDTLEQIQEQFDEESSITLPDLLGKKFGSKLRDYVAELDGKALPEDSDEIEKGSWKVARPPHKHRFVYMQSTQASADGKGALKETDDSPIKELLNVFLPSPQFRRWLQMATSSTVESHDLIARRFRRGKDYTLATGHEGKPRLELNLGITPTSGWGDDADEAAEEEEEEEEPKAKTNGKTKKGKGRGKGKAAEPAEFEEVGGHEVYMAGDDDATEDAAIYKSSSDDDNILFFQAASWNKLTIVLRDSGALKFVKYVSRKAPGDRWDICGTFEIEEQDDEGEEEEDAAAASARLLAEDTEEEWNGFSSAPESDSD
ncbi:2-oxoglutarate and Fe(II) dioxygenase domain-containing protein 1 [Pseudomassariella vexata]|uniref:uS12 prolyl 3,4-dihydroxylase n=1 Tax=Pseudomassariella vexata TaxID=1141098 RepID=A0A1Y2E4Q8_9PEZI|nr:2-oxoglutarate and Fe(II) dioxygenase domain-containing protein 1 [Pseudomassariella vexata]ORY65845.1 2-oxoglutarate and Fe(II) dioxygenase domain-containing protein 1 [Pseudomassariella vexata]